VALIRFCKVLSVIWFCFYALNLQALPDAQYRVHDVKITGLERTNRQWLDEYLNLTFPMPLDRNDLRAIELKLLTTSVFTQVKVTVENPESSRSTLHIHVEEKWTTIPVIRGVYGGGTPLRVFGMYDIHTFGRLMTFGGEMRRYGDAPPGYVLYARNPRGGSDSYYAGAEIWREFRRRDIYSRDLDPIGVLVSNMGMLRLRLLLPLASFKIGGDLEALTEGPSELTVTEEQNSPSNLYTNKKSVRHLKILPVALYDNVTINGLDYDGIRLRLRSGIDHVEHKVQRLHELDYYQYALLPDGYNLAGRVFLGSFSAKTQQSQYYLGGFDTVRGLPDGAIYGSYAAYANLELRRVIHRTKYLWVQGANFFDLGSAANKVGDLPENRRYSAGLGLRFSVPQVYRFIVRVDYGWELSGTKAHGITIGMNQFFDPYVPL
jgi:hypothetical protein